MSLQKWTVPFLMVISFLGFQNCGDNVSFDSGSSKSAAIGSTDDGSGQGLGQVDSNNDSTDDDNKGANGNGNSGGNSANGNNGNTNGGGSPVVIVDPTTPPPPVVTGNVIYDGNVSFTNCDSYQELMYDGQRLQIPAKSGNNICYYIKIFNAITKHDSGTKGEIRDQEVLSSDHNGDTKSYISPFIMGDKSVNFINSASWKMSLSGAFNDPTVKMAIDNYFLVHMTVGGDNSVEVVSAFGTADAEPGDGKMPILYKDLEVAFKSFAPNGTAFVEAIGLQAPQMPTNFNGNYDLRVRALDCGGSAELRNVYLVFH